MSVYLAGRVGDPAALVRHRPLTAFKGYAAGSELSAQFGLGTIEEVDVVVTLIDGTLYEALALTASGRYLLPDEYGI